MSKPFDTELFLAAVLTGSYTTRQRHYGKRSSYKLRCLNGGSFKHLGLGGENMWHGFLSIAWLGDATRLGIATC